MRLFAIATAAAVLAGPSLGLASSHVHPAHHAGRCSSFTFHIYFAPHSKDLTEEAGHVLHSVARRVRVCNIESVHVVGQSDAGAGGEAAHELAQARADTITSHLAALGFSRSAITTEAAPVQTSGPRVSIHRKTTVHLQLSPRSAEQIPEPRSPHP